MTFTRKLKLFATVGFGALAIPLVAMAQEAPPATTPQSQPSGKTPPTSAASTTNTLETIVVSAQRRTEDIQRVPLTVSAFTESQLASANVNSLQDLTSLVSGFQGPGVSGLVAPHIRGVGNALAQPGLENSVALYVDGVYIGAVSPAMPDLDDASQVEVLKGPQGTLFGRNTSGGLLQVATRDPSKTPELSSAMSYGNYNTTKESIYINGPVADGVNANLYIKAGNQGDGWGKNLVTGKATYRTDLDLNIRNKWDFDFGSGTSLRLIADYERLQQEGVFGLRAPTGATSLLGYKSNAAGWDVNNNTDEKSVTEAGGLAARLTHEFDFATLTNTIAYRHTRFDDRGVDADFTPIPFAQYDRYYQNAQWTEELQLASRGTSQLSWTTGFFYYRAVDKTFIPVSYGVPLIPFQQQNDVNTINADSYALYAQGSYKISRSTTVTGGLRYTYDDHSKNSNSAFLVGGAWYPGAAFGLPPFDNSFSKSSPSWRLQIAQQLTDKAMIYASYNRGVKSGGYDSSNPNDPAFKNETLDAYEVGEKWEFLDKRARLNTSAFYYSYKDIQVQGTTNTSSYIYNGAAAEMYGADADFELKVTSNLTFNATAEALHSDFSSFPNAQIYTPIPTGGFMESTGSVKGNALPLAAKFIGSLGATYLIPTEHGDWELSSNYAYNSGYFGDPSHAVRQTAYGLLGASIQYNAPRGRYYVRAWGSNLTNEKVASNLSVNNFSGVIALNAPRLFGVTVGVKFK